MEIGSPPEPQELPEGSMDGGWSLEGQCATSSGLAVRSWRSLLSFFTVILQNLQVSSKQQRQGKGEN